MSVQQNAVGTSPVRPGPLTEVCVEGLDAVRIAQDQGADRVELCAALSEGGVTPSLGTVRAAVGRIPMHVIVRPRGGDFLYTELEFLSMCEDVRLIRAAGAQGVVTGCLTPEGEVDMHRTRILVELARPLSVTFHRAFDQTARAERALEQLIACRVDRVLTSGQASTALLGVSMLQSLLAQAAGRIIILGCGRLRPDTVGEVLSKVALREIHFSALQPTESTMKGRNDLVNLGTGTTRLVTSAEQVAATIAAARSAWLNRE